MKRLLLLVLLLYIFTASRSQTILGLRDSYYAQISKSIKERFTVTLEHSLYSEHFEYQKIRLMTAYKSIYKQFTFCVEPYLSSLWNGDYQDFGIFAGGTFTFCKYYTIETLVDPHYDTDLNFDIFYSSRFKINCFNNNNFTCEYTTIPQFRIPEKRLKAGIEVMCGTLWIRPEVSIPLGREISTGRVICSFGYAL